MNDIEKATGYLLRHGVRPSAQRIAVTRFMMENPVHPSAETIHAALVREMPTLSLATVYNTLHVLVGTGAVKMLNTDSRNSRYDLVMSPHAHLCCRRCGALYDVPLDCSALPVPGAIPAGFHIDDVDVCYKGECVECAGMR